MNNAFLAELAIILKEKFPEEVSGCPMLTDAQVRRFVIELLNRLWRWEN